MEEDILLLRIIVSSKRWHIFQDADYYIYQATDEAAGGGPSLKRLPRLQKFRSPYEFDSDQVGILRCGARHQRRYNALCPHSDTAGDFYIVAALCRAPNSVVAGEFVICLYNSNSPTIWITHKISVDENQHRLQYGCHFEHYNSKVISIGGDSGTMGFVDLWRGVSISGMVGCPGYGQGRWMLIVLRTVGNRAGKSMDGKAWVIAVDMKNNTLQGVDEFVAERTIGVDFGYMHSRISKYLTATPGNHVRAMQPSSHGYFYKSFGSVIALSQYNRKSPAKLVWSIYSLMSG
ncbi:unnamed protein product [Miscanthus lutarioriparius]|uniref:Uncharacterized protein n=1 Tax=Miscanthus lutarioriparius TaxID=422564 RepID=A0A811M621_9POAL|nr:unnamed protein product [Miscanthus lutarioriparius]